MLYTYPKKGFVIDIDSSEYPPNCKRGYKFIVGFGYSIWAFFVIFPIVLQIAYGGDFEIWINLFSFVFGGLFALFFIWLAKWEKKKYFQRRKEILAQIKQGKLIVDEKSKTLLTPEEAKMNIQAKQAAERKAALEKKEYRMFCNVCGQVTCYTGKDLKDNNLASALQTLSALSTIGSAVSGSYYRMTEEQKKMDRASSKVKDYTRCPHCNSTDVSVYDEEQWKAVKKQNNKSVSSQSTIDDLRQYKELLDMGVITQEEFDAKKKQLLGL